MCPAVSAVHAPRLNQETAPVGEDGGIKVEIVSFNMPFIDLVLFLVKLALAAIPALIILAVIWVFIVAFFAYRIGVH